MTSDVLNRHHGGMKRIVLVGFASSGKSTVGDYLVEKHGYVGLSFADALKDTLAAIFCWDRAALEGVTAESRLWRETVDEWWAAKLGIPHFTPRWAMQNVGTDLFRQHFNPDIWITNVERRILDLEDQKVVVKDGRFPNEIDLVHRLGGTSLRVKRGDEPLWWNTALIANGVGSKTNWENGVISTLALLENVERANEMRAAKVTLAEMAVHPSEYSWVGHDIHSTIENDSTLEALLRKTDALIS